MFIAPNNIKCDNLLFIVKEKFWERLMAPLRLKPQLKTIYGKLASVLFSFCMINLHDYYIDS